ncbi:hypothetical protein [Sanguibacter suaedae]|uniref:Uncharacterized protein n=1 Tax=Sanguibacter suaedae TaxID=2795737 RepID=A0A934IB38_9MICO|nr:hypothetical protein [Sanguibacter suaedae]MBI9113619.1 hypothetical protein [Sanguibacter suaedae]
MNQSTVTPDDALRALADVRTRTEQVAAAPLVPAWYWSGVGALVLLLVASIESREVAFVITGSVLYAAGLTALVVAVARRAPVQAGRALLGRRGALTIVGFALGLVALGLGTAWALVAAGVPWPGTLACAVVAVALAVGGPALMAHLRRLMLARAALVA